MLCFAFDYGCSKTIFMINVIRTGEAMSIVVHVFVCTTVVSVGVFVCVCLCVTSPSVLQPEKQEDGTVTGKDRWRQKLLSAMAAGVPVTPPFLSVTSPPSSFHLPFPLPFSSSTSSPPFPFSYPAGCCLSVLLFLSHSLAATV